MSAQHTDFNYLSLLRNLERAIVRRAEAGALREKASADIIGKGVKVARELRHTLVAALGKLASSRRSERQLKANLKLTCERLRKQEEVLIRNIEECAQGLRPKQHYKLAGWPPTVGPESMVAHFAAHAIGLQSENPEVPLKENVQATWLEVVAPALAWGILAQLQDANATPEARAGVAERIRNGEHADPGVPHKTSDLPYLRLAEAWFEILDGDEPWQLSPHGIQSLRAHLATLIAEAKIAQLWETLGAHFAHVIGGSERAKAVQLASKRLPDQLKAAFLRDRLVLLESSRHPAVRELAAASRRNPAEAVQIAKAWLTACKKEPAKNHTEIACGMAYWLAHMLFKAHLREWSNQFGDASDLVGKLLKRAAEFTTSPSERTLCIRFLAGYSSNPRYYRSAFIIDQARKHIRAYEELPEAQGGLCDLFMARLYWQFSQSKRKAGVREAARQEANRLFIRALKSIEVNQLDSEAPIHLFPEIMVALNKQLQDQQGDFTAKRNDGALALIDYLAQRSYGVYFDAPTECEAIEAGCRQFAEVFDRPSAAPPQPNDTSEYKDPATIADQNEAAAKADPRMSIAEYQRDGRYQLWDQIELGIGSSRK